MKKLLCFPLLLLVFHLQAQQGVAFKIKYRPNYNYAITVDMEIMGVI